MILDIVKKPNVILRQKTKTIEPENIANYKILIQDMFETLKKHGGVGLAAPQVGSDLSLFVISLEGQDYVFINPVVIEASNEMSVQPEGCLSIPGLVLDIPRSKRIKVMFRDETGSQQVSEFDEWWARIFLHEFDHLQGILIDDRVGPVKLMLAKKKAAKKARLVSKFKKDR